MNLDETWHECLERITRTSRRVGAGFPHLSIGGRYDENPPEWWTNGFWPGILWMAYQATGDAEFRRIAEKCEEKLDVNFREYDHLDHDVGFLWLLSSVANHRITGSEQSRRRGMLAASVLASRFNLRGGYIRAWNHRNAGVAIIDTMMNLPLLHWASRRSGDPRFAYIAAAHADKALEHFLRPDGSVHHIVEFNADSGDFVRAFGGQGFELGSSWTRGQAWAIYGFARSYIHTGQDRYREASRKVADYFLASLPEDGIPPCDFRCPPEGLSVKDSTAGAIAASGLMDLAEKLPDGEGHHYREAAERIMESLWTRCALRAEDEEALIGMGTVAYHEAMGRNTPIIYGDFFFLEALAKLRGTTESFW